MMVLLSHCNTPGSSKLLVLPHLDAFTLWFQLKPLFLLAMAAALTT
jgi:hypothetical protein